MNKIVVLDGHTANPGDLSWDQFESLGDLKVYERTDGHAIAERAVDAEIVLTNKALLSREVIQALPNLKYIGVMATGYNVVDIPAAAERDIVVTNVPVYSTASVAQMVFAHILAHTQRVAEHASAVRSGRWATADDWCFWDFPLIELSGRTLGVIGYGRIGKAVAQIALAMGMRVLIQNRSPKQLEEGMEQVALDRLARESDVISLHCPLTPETEGLVNHDLLAKMKSTALLINTGRGPLVDESALAAALNEGRIAGAGLDVLHDEPPPAAHPLYEARNCNITPHIAWATAASRRRLLATVCENIRAYLDGHPVNVVS